MHIYFSGIGGVGIGPLALLALDAGYTVSGSDLQPSGLTRALEARGANIEITTDESHITATHQRQPIDWLVYSAALPVDHPELVFAKKSAIKTSKRADFLNELLKKLDLKLIAVSGTHGKTTTTGMLIWLFQQLNIPASYSIGTTLSFGPAAQYQKDSQYFIYECDEFDRNFLEFQPHISLITSLDYDHPDTYSTEADYLAAFSQFASKSKLCITWQSVAEKIKSDSHLFVVPEDQDLTPITLAGNHTRRNAWLAATAVNRLGLVDNDLKDWQKLLSALSSFPGTNRRFEKLADNFYTDYAHHPVEIAATIQMARELNPSVVVVYQPHQNIRQHELLDSKGYRDCFNDAQHVYWLPTYLSREHQDLPTLSPQQLIESIENSDQIEPAVMNDGLHKKIKAHLEKGDLVLGMSAGDLDAWLRNQLNKS